MPLVATVNLNGIRAACRRGFGEWLAEREPDVLCLQEVRADTDVLRECLGPQWHVVHSAGAQRGRAGVAVAARRPLTEVRYGLPGAEDGRWVEATVGRIRVVSTYVHKGEAGTDRQLPKYAFLESMCERMAELQKEGDRALVCGDLNVCHRELDLKNWKNNLKHSGFLPQERAFLDRIVDDLGWVDVVRARAGEVPGPYTWWSWRGKAFDNDAGWRIDYQYATPALARRARAAVVDRAPSYDRRWSDHAPVVVRYG